MFYSRRQLRKSGMPASNLNVWSEDKVNQGQESPCFALDFMAHTQPRQRPSRSVNP